MIKRAFPPVTKTPWPANLPPNVSQHSRAGIFIDGDEMGGFGLRLAKKKTKVESLQLPNWSFACPLSLDVKLDGMSPGPKR